jgi:hypothetical protein
MNDFIKQVIEEKFASKAQQRYFYAKANEKGTSKKEKKKWKKWASEFSSDTNFEKIPEKVDNKEEDIEEIVDEKGDIKRSDVPKSIKKSLIGSKKRTDKVVKTAAGAMGIHSVHGTHTSLKYWAEGQEVKEIAKFREINIFTQKWDNQLIFKFGWKNWLAYHRFRILC